MAEILAVASLRDEIAQMLWKLGRACAPDLANQLKSKHRPADLIPILNQMVSDGILKLDREGDIPERNVYKLAK